MENLDNLCSIESSGDVYINCYISSPSIEHRYYLNDVGVIRYISPNRDNNSFLVELDLISCKASLWCNINELTILPAITSKILDI